MAGIGFELKKIFQEGTFASTVRGSTYAVFVTSGPMILNLLMITAMLQLLKVKGMPRESRDLFESSIMYAYIFSLLIVSGWIMVISRYVSDKIYRKDTRDLLASLLGILALCCLTGGVPGAVFYAFSPLPLSFRFFSGLIFLELCILNVLMVYVSAARDYRKVAVSFSLGLGATLLFSLLLQLFPVGILTAVLAGVALGFFVNLLFLVTVLKSTFGFISPHCFNFLHALGQHPRLFFTNFLYTLGLFGHNLIFWFLSDLSVSAMNTYRYAPNYDAATFYAIFTIIPAIVIFVVKVETSFYDQFSRLEQAICQGGTLRDIRRAKDRVSETVRTDMIRLFELQLIITVLCILLGNLLILPLLGTNRQTTELFSYLAVGFFLAYMVYCTITLLLYFDHQKGALLTASLFGASSLILTLLTLRLGAGFYGLGLCGGGLMAFPAGVCLLIQTLDEAIYRIYTGYTLAR